MLTRISCRACHFESLWTDDPAGFLRSACCRPGSCKATMLHEPLMELRQAPKSTSRARHARRAPSRETLAS
jgi:hypothetical protein